jgi:uncharacterized protein (TIGR00251 family)
MSGDTWDIRPEGTGCVFKVQVTPRSSKNLVEGFRLEALRLRVQAPPVEGAANAAVIGYFSESLGVSKSSVEVVRGLTSRTKWVRVQGRGVDQVRRSLGLMDPEVPGRGKKP